MALPTKSERMDFQLTRRVPRCWLKSWRHKDAKMSNKDDFNARIKRVQDAISLKEPDRLQMIPFVNGLPYALYKKGSHRADYYGFEENAEPYYLYHKEFQPDVALTPMF
jgi:hypothetical protein